MGLRDKHLFHDKNIFFITSTCRNFLHLLSIGDCFTIISDSLNFCSQKYGASILSYVIMPNHIHLVVHFIKGEERSGFIRDFKKFTSTQIRKQVEIHKPEMLNQLRINKEKRIFKVWKERFDEVYLESRSLLETKINYIHNNPLQERWNLASRPEEYSYSSAKFYEKEEQPLVEVKHYLDFV